MHPTLRIILGIIIGLVVGNLVNGGLIMLSPFVIPPPEGVNVNDAESLKANIHLFKPINFLFPFLAHALGTFVAAFVAVKIAKNRQLFIPLIIGGLFLIGGIMMVNMLPAPMWFNILDLVVAYIPMALLGWKLAK